MTKAMREYLEKIDLQKQIVLQVILEAVNISKDEKITTLQKIVNEWITIDKESLKAK